MRKRKKKKKEKKKEAGKKNINDIMAELAKPGRDPREQEGRPGQLGVCAGPGLAVVEDRTEPEGALHVAPATFDLQELLVGRGEVIGGQGGIGGA